MRSPSFSTRRQLINAILRRPTPRSKDPEVKKKMSEARKAYWEKNAGRFKGEGNPMFGKTVSEETKEKIRAAKLIRDTQKKLERANEPQ